MAKIINKKSSVVGKIPAPADLEYGELALNYADGKLFYKASNNSIQSFGGAALSNAVRQQFTATAGQTNFSINYTPGQLDVYLNGVKLVTGSDYTATTGTGFTLTTAATAGDIVDVVAGIIFASSDWTYITNKPTTLSGFGITDAQALSTNLTAISALTGTNGFVRTNGSGTWSVDTSAYITGNQNIVFSGDATGNGTTSVSLTLANSGVTAGLYGSTTNIPQITVDAKGRVTSVTNVAVSIPSGSLTFTGDVTGTGTTGSSTALTLANSGVTAGTYTKTTVDAKGRVTSGTTLSASDIPNLDASKITSGTIDAARLPSYVDDVLEYTNLAGFPGTGESGKIYVAIDTNKVYRWSGSAYVYITSGAVDSVAGRTGVVTLTSSDVGLGSVENKNSATIRSEITSTNVTTALGFTPYNSTNPNGYITSSALSSYLPLTGGTISGVVRINNQLQVGQNTNGTAFIDAYGGYAWFGRDSNSSGIRIDASGNVHTTAALNSAGALTQSGNQILHAGNYSSYALPLSGGTTTGSVHVGAAIGSRGTSLSVSGSNASSPFAAKSGSYSTVFAMLPWAGGQTYLSTGTYYDGSTWVHDSSDTTNALFAFSGGSGATWYASNNSSPSWNTASAVALWNQSGTWTGALNAGSGAQVAGNTIVHAGNYSSYSPTLTGGSASGTWGINITGNANTASYAIWSNVTSFTTASAGWYRVATTGGDGRGTYNVELHTTGGNHNPAILQICAQGDWGNDKIVYANWDGSFPANAVRITRSATNTFLEVYFIVAIVGAAIRINRTGFDNVISAYTGSLPAGGDTVQDTLTINSKINASSISVSGSTVLNAGNYSSYALPLTGGTLTGNLNMGAQVINFGGQSDSLGYNSVSGLGMYIKGTSSTYVYGGGSFYDGSAHRTILHAGNYSSYALPISGGGLTGATTLTAGHGDTRFQLKFNYSGDVNSIYSGSLLLWVSEPGLSYAYSGIGANINNGGQYYGRQATGQPYGVFIRFNTDAGEVQFWNTSGTPGAAGGQGTQRAYIATDGEMYLTSSSNKVLHAGNYTNYITSGIPSQTGNSGKFLTTDGTNTSWAVLPLPPGAPSTCTATASATAGQVDVSWSASSLATSYTIYYGTTTPLTTANSQGSVSVGNVTSGSVTGITNYNTYYFAVVGINSNGIGGLSPQSSAIPNNAPAAPTLTSVNVTSGTSVSIAWTGVTAQPSATYRVYYSLTSPVTTSSSYVTATTSPTSITGLTANTTYYFKVAAINSYGTTLSTQSNATTPPAGTVIYSAGNTLSISGNTYQTIFVDSSVTKMRVRCVGGSGGGGGGWNSPGAAGGYSGFADAEITVANIPDRVFYVYSGGAGTESTNNPPYHAYYRAGGSGGGGSVVYGLNNGIVYVAGGAGGGGGSGWNGTAGTGGNGGQVINATGVGNGSNGATTQSAGGTGGSSVPGTNSANSSANGSGYSGGNGGDQGGSGGAANSTIAPGGYCNTTYYWGGGGGGGGYRGGAGGWGSSAGDGGGGGSSYVNPSYCTGYSMGSAPSIAGGAGGPGPGGGIASSGSSGYVTINFI